MLTVYLSRKRLNEYWIFNIHVINKLRLSVSVEIEQETGWCWWLLWMLKSSRPVLLSTCKRDEFFSFWLSSTLRHLHNSVKWHWHWICAQQLIRRILTFCFLFHRFTSILSSYKPNLNLDDDTMVWTTRPSEIYFPLCSSTLQLVHGLVISLTSSDSSHPLHFCWQGFQEI